VAVSEPTSTKPYLLRAVYEWCVDNGYTPHITVAVDPQTRVPAEYVRDGEIVLNIGPVAASRLKMGNEFIEFSARFSGAAKEIVIPVAAVAAIYARETEQGMSFELEKAKGEQPTDAPEPPRSGGKPALKRVK
jgi:stringent starvation protein B